MIILIEGFQYSIDKWSPRVLMQDMLNEIRNDVRDNIV